MMSKFVINGGGKLRGVIEVNGAKNDALVIFAASLLTDKLVSITNVPDIEDIKRLAEILEKIGVEVKNNSAKEYRIQAKEISNTLIDPEIAKRLRASILLTAPLLARKGTVSFPHPGGCVIGERPINLFLEGYSAMGAKVSYKEGIYTIKSPELQGTKFVFSNISVTGTEAMIMAAVLARGVTILKNCACEPEVVSLASFLTKSGAKIKGAGTPEITIEGVKKVNKGEHEIIPDRVEAGSLAILAAATGSNLTISRCNPEHLDSLWDVFRTVGIKVKINKDSVSILAPNNKKGKIKSVSSVSIKTREYPGFPTDLQAPFCVLLTQAEGQALVHETIYEGRLNWAEELKRMGADILNLDPHRIEIRGPTKLRGRGIESPDIRAGMAYIIAALCAEGQSVINNIYQIDRGYEKIEERLQKIGADIRRI